MQPILASLIVAGIAAVIYITAKPPKPVQPTMPTTPDNPDDVEARTEADTR